MHCCYNSLNCSWRNECVEEVDNFKQIIKSESSNLPHKGTNTIIYTRSIEHSLISHHKPNQKDILQHEHLNVP